MPGPEPADLYAVFAPKAAKIVAVFTTILFGALMISLALVVPGLGVPDQAGFVSLAVLVGWLMSRLAGVKAIPTPEGLLVRNLFVTTRLEWAQIVNVRFGDLPWPLLDLADGDTLSVMGIQRADGYRSRAEAVRLANLVELHSAPDH